MSLWSLEILEFEALKSLVGRYLGGPLGKALLEALEPSTDRQALEARHAEVAEATEWLREAAGPRHAAGRGLARFRFSGRPDPREAVARLRIEGAGLDAAEIQDLARLLEFAAELRTALVEAAKAFPLLGARGRRMGDFRDLLRQITNKFGPDGGLADDASPLLARVRRDIAKLERQISESLERFLLAHRDSRVLQEDYVTIRNDRFVVPVVAGQLGRARGVVHGASNSGQTLYVEPLETIDLNNQLVNLREEEAREVHRILRYLTDLLRSQAPAIRETVDTLGHLDLLFGIADFAIAFDCVTPRFSPPGERRISLEGARHPLLADILNRQGGRVVPLSLSLTLDASILLISGPNTGGKSVALKTAGLLALMAQSGLPVSCASAEFPLFDRVLADIGDNQSIAESLSTFSAHIGHIREILESVTPDSLVLLDELGRATDPEEGGALGVAILDELRAQGAFTLASTHLVAIKLYGTNTPGVVNGSMGFDDQTLQPTYVLRTGLPGKSAGLAIARRLGLPAPLLDRARASMTRAEQDMSDFLARLEQRLEQTAALQTGLTRQQADLAAREKALEEQFARREAARLRELEARCEEALARFSERADRTLGDLARETADRKTQERAARRISREKRELRADFSASVSAAATQPPAAEPAAVAPGQRVRVRDVRQPVRVTRLLHNGMVEVESGFVKLQIPATDVLEILPDAPPPSRLPSGVSFKGSFKETQSLQEINVIGKHAEEAVEEVERFLDRASLADVSRVRIIHGHGKGILQRAIAAFLSESPLVERFHPADSLEGGTGATIAELRG